MIALGVKRSDTPGINAELRVDQERPLGGRSKKSTVYWILLRMDTFFAFFAFFVVLWLFAVPCVVLTGR